MLGNITSCRTAAANMFHILNDSQGSTLYFHSNPKKNIIEIASNITGDFDNEKRFLNGDHIGTNAKIYINDDDIDDDDDDSDEDDAQRGNRIRKENENEKVKDDDEEDKERQIVSTAHLRNTVISGTGLPQPTDETGVDSRGRVAMERVTGDGLGIRLCEESLGPCADSSYLEMIRSVGEAVNIGAYVHSSCSHSNPQRWHEQT